MAQSMDLAVYSPQREALLGIVTDINGIRFTKTFNEPGDGGVVIRLDHPDIALFDYDVIVAIRIDATEVFAFPVQSRDTVLYSNEEHSAQARLVGGAGVGSLLGTGSLGGAVVLPGCGGDLDGFSASIRYFGWMACCCFDHAAEGFGPPALADRQGTPEPPWRVDNPSNWPDPNAYRIFGGEQDELEPGVIEVQSISLGTSIISGTFEIVHKGETSDPIGSPWSAAQVEAAFEGFDHIDAVTVTGAGIDGDEYIITYDGTDVAYRNQPLPSVQHETLDHPPQTAQIRTVTPGQHGQFATEGGCSFFFYEFTTAADLDLIAFINMSRFGEVYIDGVEVYSQSAGSGTSTTRTVPVTLPAGDHCIAARVCKRGSAGNGFLMMTLAEATEGEDGQWILGTIVARTNPAWSVLHQPAGADAPGVTVGDILTCLWAEDGNLFAPTLYNIGLDFDGDVDSNGTPWADHIVYGVQVGTGLMDVVQELSEIVGFRWSMSPDLTLSIWQEFGTDRSDSVEYVGASHAGGILGLQVSGTGTAANSLLIETQDGFTFVDSVSTAPPRILGLTVGTAREYESLSQFADNTLDELGETQTAALTTWGPSGLVPLSDFDISDWIKAPDDDLIPATWSVETTQAVMSEDGATIWSLFLKSLPD